MVMKIRDEWGVKVNIAAPKMTQEAVIKEFGYPVVSKRAAKRPFLQYPFILLWLSSTSVATIEAFPFSFAQLSAAVSFM